MGENIGAVARAMSNFGLTELRLVAPRDGWPNVAAEKTASGAEDLIANAKVFDDFSSAVADVQLAYATTARPRDMEKRVVTPSEAMAEIVQGPQRVAFVFGPERTGLENEEITLCDTLITIPTAANKSLNLGQSAVILGYEYWQAKNAGLGIKEPAKEDPLASMQDWNGLFAQLESYLDEVNYYRVPDKKTIMWQNLRTMFLRARFSDQEVRTLRGMLRSIWERRVRNSEPE
jgi:tRNA/rRNA methyltransferase